jgi:hypothetical protein
MPSRLRSRLALFAVTAGCAAVAAPAIASAPKPVAVTALRLFLLNQQIPTAPARRLGNTARYSMYLDLVRHGKSLDHETAASKKYDDPGIDVFFGYPASALRCRPEPKGDKYTIVEFADGRFCWSHLKAIPTVKGDQPQWAVSLYYRNVRVTWNFPGQRNRSIPAGIFEFDALMRQFLATL